MTRHLDTDLLIIGSEGAGAMAAIGAHDLAAKRGCKLEIAMVTKGRMAKSGATLTGGADMSVDSRSLKEMGFEATDPNDSKEAFFEDIIKGGKYLNNQKLVEIFVEEAPRRIKDLLDWGGGWEGIERGTQYIEKVASHSSGHSYPRGAMMRGPRLVHILKEQVMKRDIDVINYVMITDLLTDGNRVLGAVGLNLLSGEFFVFKAKSVVLASGGMLEIYPYSTGPVELTGDGHAMAFRAGVELIDIEFPMFIPGASIWPRSVKGDLKPFVLACGGEESPGWMINGIGVRFMKRYDPKHMEKTTRDILSIASMIEVMDGRGSPHGGVYYSLGHLSNNIIENYINRDWASLQAKEASNAYCPHSINYYEFYPDLRKEAWEALAACHYTNGGVRINEKCETNIAGLFAAGECLGGMMGANRLSGNAFTEFLVWGYRAGRFSAEHAMKIQEAEVDDEQIEKLRKRIFTICEREEGTKPSELRHRVQKLAWEKVGIVRSGDGLKEALKEIERMWKEEIPLQCMSKKSRIFNREWFEALENENLLLGLELIARAALLRTESRGAHFRLDYRNTDYKNWSKNIVVKRVEGKINLITEPLVTTKMRPPEKVVPYGEVE